MVVSCCNDRLMSPATEHTPMPSISVQDAGAQADNTVFADASADDSSGASNGELGDADDANCKFGVAGERGVASGASEPGPSSGLGSALTQEQLFLSLVLRSILFLGPAVMPSKVATPALVFLFFASEMSFLAGIVPGRRAAFDGAIEALFKDAPMKGWDFLCREFAVCERGLFLSGRISAEAQLVGQPDSVPLSVNKKVNPTGRHQYVSKRMSMRPDLDLWVVQQNELGTGPAPGAVTEAELSGLRALLSTANGRGTASAAGCRIVPGVTPDGEATTMARLEFNWRYTWADQSPAVLLVGKLQKGLLKGPTSDLATVSKFPLRAVEGAPSDCQPTLKGKRPASARNPSSLTKTRSAPRRSKKSKSAKVPAATQMIFPALSAVPGVITGVLDASAAWPLGAWALQLPLDSYMDLGAEGKVEVTIKVLSRPTTKTDRSLYGYNLLVSQTRIIPTPISTEVGQFVTTCGSLPLPSRCRSVDFLQAARRIAAEVLRVRATRRADQLYRVQQSVRRAVDGLPENNRLAGKVGTPLGRDREIDVDGGAPWLGTEVGMNTDLTDAVVAEVHGASSLLSTDRESLSQSMGQNKALSAAVTNALGGAASSGGEGSPFLSQTLSTGEAPASTGVLSAIGASASAATTGGASTGAASAGGVSAGASARASAMTTAGRASAGVRGGASAGEALSEAAAAASIGGASAGGAFADGALAAAAAVAAAAAASTGRASAGESSDGVPEGGTSGAALACGASAGAAESASVDAAEMANVAAKCSARTRTDAMGMRLTFAPPPPVTTFAFAHSFSSQECLSTNVVELERAPGRLWIVVPVVSPVEHRAQGSYMLCRPSSAERRAHTKLSLLSNISLRGLQGFLTS